MSLLPGRIVPSVWLLVASSLLLGTSYLLLATKPVSAQAGWSIELSVSCSDPQGNLFTTATIPGPVGEDGYIKIYKDGTLYKTLQDFAPGTPNYPLGSNPPGNYYATIHDTFTGPVLDTSDTITIDVNCQPQPQPTPQPTPTPSPQPSPTPTPLPPNIKPCENPLYTDKLTKVVLEPIEYTFERTGTENQEFTLQHTFTVEVDFSKLAAIFASPNSNYQESRFQDESHRKANILSLPRPLFNLFHGPGQKAAAKVMTDDLKVKYVNYIYTHLYLPEAAFTYTDLEGGGGPKTIEELVNEFGLPEPPEAGEDRTAWLATWGRYWEKIPTAVNEFYMGIFIFPLVVGNAELEEINKGRCPGRERERKIYFVIPEYFRTTSIANQLNQLIVPNAAQSSDADFTVNNLQAANSDDEGVFSKIIAACLKPLTNNPLSKALIKVIKISFNLTNPIKDAFAAVKPPPGKLPEPCPAPIPVLPNDKEGTGPFCSLPPFKPGTNDPQLKPGESCENVESPNKLDKGTLVKCTFLAQPFNSTRLIKKPEDARKGGWDKCEEAGTNSSGQPLYKCTLTIRVFPTFYIPWLAPIWNNTTYSDEADKIAVFGDGKTGKDQETGRPGVYTFFKPKSVDFEVFPEGKNLPSEEQGGAEEIRQRFFGAVDCNKEFTRDWALKPKALQNFLGISNTCEI